MTKTNSVKKVDEEMFPEWDYFVTEIAQVFNLTKKEEQNFYNCSTARIIATIPFVAGCVEPERTAIAHLCIYEAEIKGFQRYYAHLPCDDNDIFNRLAFISTFEGGNPAIIEHGMNMLAHIMLEGYNHTKEKDLQEGIYNPIANGIWNYNEMKKQIENKIDEILCPELDKFFMLDDGEWHGK